MIVALEKRAVAVPLRKQVEDFVPLAALSSPNFHDQIF